MRAGVSFTPSGKSADCCSSSLCSFSSARSRARSSTASGLGSSLATLSRRRLVYHDVIEPTDKLEAVGIVLSFDDRPPNAIAL